MHDDQADTFDAEYSGPTMSRYIVMAALCGMAAVAYLGRDYAIGVSEKQVRADLNLTEQQLGVVMGMFFIGYSVFQIPGGWLGKLFGSRIMLTIFILVSSAGMLLMAVATSFTALISLRIIIGCAQAGIFPTAAATIQKWFPMTQRAIASGSMASFMSVGGAAAGPMAALLLTGSLAVGSIQLAFPAVSWRIVFALFALPGIVWALWFFWWFRERPEEHPSVNDEELAVIHQRTPAEIESARRNTGPSADEPTPWLAMLTSLPMWMICGQQFFRGAGFIFYGTWFPKFLKESRGVTPMESGLLMSLPLLATVVGCSVGGAAIDAIYKATGSARLSRQAVAIVNMLLCAVLIGLAYFIHDPKAAVLLISAGSFFAAVGGPAAYTVTIDMAGPHVPLVFSTMNMSGNIAAALCPMVVPMVVSATGSWNSILFFFSGIYVAAAVCWMLINPKGVIGGTSPA